jgi:hypothetical protein
MEDVIFSSKPEKGMVACFVEAVGRRQLLLY